MLKQRCFCAVLERRSQQLLQSGLLLLALASCTTTEPAGTFIDESGEFVMKVSHLEGGSFSAQVESIERAVVTAEKSQPASAGAAIGGVLDVGFKAALLMNGKMALEKKGELLLPRTGSTAGISLVDYEAGWDAPVVKLAGLTEIQFKRTSEDELTKTKAEAARELEVRKECLLEADRYLRLDRYCPAKFGEAEPILARFKSARDGSDKGIIRHAVLSAISATGTRDGEFLEGLKRNCERTLTPDIAALRAARERVAANWAASVREAARMSVILEEVDTVFFRDRVIGGSMKIVEDQAAKSVPILTPNQLLTRFLKKDLDQVLAARQFALQEETLRVLASPECGGSPK